MISLCTEEKYLAIEFVEIALTFHLDQKGHWSEGTKILPLFVSFFKINVLTARHTVAICVLVEHFIAVFTHPE